MSYPGFEISENIVGKSVDFDIIRLEKYEELQNYWQGDPPPRVNLTNESQKAVECVLESYYEMNPEIRDWHPPNGSIFRFSVRESDIEILLNCLSYCLVLQLSSSVPFEFASEEPKAILYSEFISEDLNCEISDPEWEELDDSPVRVEEKIEDQIPSGYVTTDLSREKFQDYTFNTLRPIAIESDWPEGAAWSINLALHELRKGQYKEAAYAFAAVRNSVTKSPNPFEEVEYNQLLNKYLITLRDLSLHHSSANASPAKQERFIEISDRPYVFVPRFSSEPSFQDPYFRMTSPIWIANALTFTAGVANALGAPTISRSEIDPFGTEMTFDNLSFVLRAAKELVEIDKKQNQKEDPIGYLDYIDFRQFAPEAILSDVFESIGYENLGTIQDSFTYKGETIPFEPDLALEKDGSLYLVFYQNPEHKTDIDVEDLQQDISDMEIDPSLILVSEAEYSESIIKTADDSTNVELYYLDTTSNILRTVDAGLPVDEHPPVTNEEVRERLRVLYTAASTSDDSQTKGDLFEKFTELLFNKLIPDTEVLRVNSETVAEEFDLVLRNSKENEPWQDLSSIIMVECKNWSKPVGSSIVHTLNSKADILGSQCSTGLLISWNGITGSDYEDAANQRIRELKQQDFEVLHFDSTDLNTLIDSQNPNEVFDERYVDLITEY